MKGFNPDDLSEMMGAMFKAMGDPKGGVPGGGSRGNPMSGLQEIFGQTAKIMESLDEQASKKLTTVASSSGDIKVTLNGMGVCTDVSLAESLLTSGKTMAAIGKEITELFGKASQECRKHLDEMLPDSIMKQVLK